MAIPLVAMFPNSITLVLAGNWNNSPGDSSMNRITATTTGPQSALMTVGLVFNCRCQGEWEEMVAGDLIVRSFLAEKEMCWGCQTWCEGTPWGQEGSKALSY
ncbi:hypothetical protein SAY87_008601 [Trapa incisa]|uniref:Uncharacterized protein n=1 Tax=Trapa incisa TaxID=236973 RepID=A0AAN7JXU0_9MYRT|nr:hypothetical protein SAY87_008601 [Trapa incisa]